MKTIRRVLCLLLALTLLSLPWPLRAQGEQEIVVIHVVTEPQSDGLGLQVYFVLRDANGDPILKDNVRLDEEGSIELLGAGALPSEATISIPRTPIKVLLLMDASGSMRPIIGDVQQAARKAVESAPDTALLAVAQFSQLGPDQPLNLLQGFTENRQLVTQAIDAIDPQPRAPTCLYNAAFQAIETLKAAEDMPQERQAIILFTDGKDDSGDGNSCSSRTVANVIAGARERGMPLYTIGLCENAACKNLESDILRAMADETGGVSALGQQGELEDLFQRIMDGLSSQWVAEAVVFPRKGPNRANLNVSIGNDGSLLSQPFTFVSDADYDAPSSFAVTPIYQPEQDRYEVTIEVSNPATVESVTLEIRGKPGLLVSQDYTPEELDQPVEITTERLTAGEEYCFHIKATGRNGVELKGPEGEAFLVRECVEYDPRLSFAITSVDPDWENRKLLIAVTVRGASSQTPLFEGRITDKGGQTVATVQRISPNGAGNLVIDLPPTFLRAAPESEFLVSLTLEDGGDRLDQVLGFRITPPSGSGQWIIFSAIGLVLTLGIAAFLMGRRLSRPKSGATILGPAPLFNDLTRQLEPAAVGTQLRITVVKSSAAAQQSLTKLISKDNSPFVIGRSQTAQFTIDDKEMSKSHVQITVAGREFFITDLNSLNGTFVNGSRLPSNTRTVLAVPSEIRLGHNTIVKVEQV